MPVEPSDYHIAVLSIHPLYDTRIGNHIRTLLDEGYRVTYINWSKELPGAESPSFGDARLVHRSSESAFGWNVFRFLAMLWWFLNQTRRASPDIAHLHDVLLLPLALPLRIWRVRVVFDVHEHFCDFPGLIGTFSRWSYRVFLPFVDGLVGVVPSTLPPSHKPSCVVPNYQRPSDFVRKQPHGENGQPTTVVYFGSLSSLDRDIELMLDMIELVLKQSESLRFKIGGRLYGPGTDVYRAHFEALQARFPNRLSWFGELPRKRVIEESASADVGLLLLRKDSPNIASSSPNKIFEYLATGAAIFATDGFEIADEVRGSAGVLVTPGQTADRAASLLISLAADKPRLERMKQASSALGERYTWESVAVRYRELYERLLQK